VKLNGNHFDSSFMHDLHGFVDTFSVSLFIIPISSIPWPINQFHGD